MIFGGQSSEHVVSCMSAINVIENIDRSMYDVILVGITEKGNWLKVDTLDSIKCGSWTNSKIQALLLPDAQDRSILINDKDSYDKIKIDVVFPVLHGLYGEDGTIQGLCELAGIPYVGSGVLASAVSMDKVYTKIIVERLGIKQAAYEVVLREEFESCTDDVYSSDDYKNTNKTIPEDRSWEDIVKRVESRFGYPMFVKPSNAGSSRGITKATDAESLKNAVKTALKHDRKVLIEEAVNGREIECAVLGSGAGVKASGVGEILAGADFYDFDAKYYSTQSKTVINPKLPNDAEHIIPEYAKKIFNAVDGFGLARVDFFVKPDGEAVFNEINTMPGFTAISMYPMLWEAAGLNKKELIKNLIELSFKRDSIYGF
ncbi:hypothetical protein HMPREF9333_01113 [Johnsonella ignava ATCC 51276]|uniref:D-alanine--D-alanine ligase n=1 Tax=Johnsonella ignava ATCC 51276 TaxID=679200 RepID=G5GHS3_9FIRM|nr:hypothetical protein HMPREF9333_01113 [Johnsonella ignava ATCC 51276]